MRFQRTAQGQRQTCQAGVSSAIEKKMISPASDQILERHVADAALVAGEPRVARIVAIVAHHEIVAGRNLVDLGVVEGAVVAVDLDDFVFDAARQRLDDSAAPPPACRSG